MARDHPFVDGRRLRQSTRQDQKFGDQVHPSKADRQQSDSPTGSAEEAKQESKSDESLSDFFNRQQSERADFAEAFNRELCEEPGLRKLVEEQVKGRLKLDQLQIELAGIRQSLLIGNLLSFLLVACVGVLIVWMFRNPTPNTGMPANSNPQANPTVSESPVTNATGIETPQPNRAESPIVINRDHRQKLDVLYSEVRSIGTLRTGSGAERADSQDLYIQVFYKLSEAIEEASEANYPREYRLTLVNLANLAQTLNENHGQIDFDTKSLISQIEAVIHPKTPFQESGVQ